MSTITKPPSTVNRKSTSRPLDVSLLLTIDGTPNGVTPLVVADGPTFDGRPATLERDSS